MLKDVVLVQKAELEQAFKDLYVERDVKPFSLGHNLIKVIIGPRRAGKSFFVIHSLRKTGSFGYANFDNEELAQVKEYDDIVSEINQVYGKPKVLFFDEIQNLPNWELFVNRLQRQGFNIVVTGSNSHLLSRELATHLTGRHMPTNILTFSFSEFLSAKGIDTNKVPSTQIKEQFFEYLQKGGYPETIVKNLDQKQYLSVLFESILYKDIIKRYNTRKGKEIEKLALFLLSNAGTEFSHTATSAAIGLKSHLTAQKYLGYLEEAYLFFIINNFSFKTKQQAQSKKIYCFDNGLIYAKAFQASQNLGKLLENVVAIHLKKQQLDGQLDIYYWKNQQKEEVDFVVKKELKVIQLIQACYDPKNPETKKREVRALINASQETKCKNLLVVTNDYEAEEEHEWFGAKAKIKFIPACKWLLEKQ
ncbi:MAG: ATP-binding protein [Candidatus Diapherotrites archaeon]|nr:ATP-binding protein [Candidatus Diapherotrites archaeon]